MINESNFHIYLDDFVNGLLDEEMELAFVAFLDQHPGIMDGEELHVPTLSLEGSFKESLKKSLTLDENNTDEWLIASLEGDLSTSEQRLLATYIEQHPALEQDKALFALTVLEADKALVFPHKEKLKQRPAIYLYARWSSAIAAVLLLGFLFFRPSGSTDTEITPLSDVRETPTEIQVPDPNKGMSREEMAVIKKENRPAPAKTTDPAIQAEPKKESPHIAPMNIDGPLVAEINTPEPSLLPVEENEAENAPVAMTKGQSIWQWGYKKLRKSVGAEEIIIPEREIPGDALDLVLAKVAPIVQYDQNDKGSVLRIGSFEINRKTAKQ